MNTICPIFIIFATSINISLILSRERKLDNYAANATNIENAQTCLVFCVCCSILFLTITRMNGDQGGRAPLRWKDASHALLQIAVQERYFHAQTNSIQGGAAACPSSCRSALSLWMPVLLHEGGRGGTRSRRCHRDSLSLPRVYCCEPNLL